ncbi:trypsin-like serine protease [Pseudomonas fluorescens]|uniref:trypsin-like serine protease n=1 Tax=Pseudomonas fluorescens TaxID=294 RepID=UPI001A9E7A1C|nr:trypsin-like serine protease [Pseudomonas fluorescens]QTD31302.1 trypsin-like serine protease [Pseudomonas fluorescens]
MDILFSRRHFEDEILKNPNSSFHSPAHKFCVFSQQEKFVPVFAVLSLLLTCHETVHAENTDPSSEFEAWSGNNDAQGEIINGVSPANPAKWNSIYLSKKDTQWCTAFAVGPRTVMTAAHCIPKDKTIVLKRPGQDDVTATCKTPKSYPSDITSDYAMCASQIDISLGPFETLNTQKKRLKYSTTIILTGYGCRQLENQKQKEFSIGKANFVNMADGNYGVVSGTATVCFGDSGGPAFIASEEDISNRILIGINSRWMSTEYGSYSLLSLLPTNVDYFFQELSDAGWKICGITPNVKNCRHE